MCACVHVAGAGVARGHHRQERRVSRNKRVALSAKQSGVVGRGNPYLREWAVEGGKDRFFIPQKPLTEYKISHSPLIPGTEIEFTWQLILPKNTAL